MEGRFTGGSMATNAVPPGGAWAVPGRPGPRMALRSRARSLRRRNGVCQGWGYKTREGVIG